MKRLVFLSLILLVVGCGSIFAQRGGGGGGGGGGRGGMIGGGGAGGGGNPTAGGRAGNENRPDRNGVGRDNRNSSDGAGNREGQHREIGKALRGLDLSDAQKQQIRDIQKSAKENQTDRETVASQIKAVLTPEQIEKLEARKEKKKERKENRPNPNPGATSQPNN